MTEGSREDDQSAEAVRCQPIEQGVKYCLPSYVDIHGILRAKQGQR